MQTVEDARDAEAEQLELEQQQQQQQQEMEQKEEQGRRQQGEGGENEPGRNEGGGALLPAKVREGVRGGQRPAAGRSTPPAAVTLGKSKRKHDSASLFDHFAVLYAESGMIAKAKRYMLQALDAERRADALERATRAAQVAQAAQQGRRGGGGNQVGGLRGNPRFAQYCAHLAILYRHNGEYTKAIPLYRDVVEYHKLRHGKLNLQYVAHCSQLGALCESAKNYSLAEAQYRIVRDTLRHPQLKLGSQHPAVALACANLARCYERMGRVAKAVDSFDDAITIIRDHPDYGR